MNYEISFTWSELETLSKVLQEWPYRIVAPLLKKIWDQVDEQNKTLDSKPITNG